MEVQLHANALQGTDIPLEQKALKSSNGTIATDYRKGSINPNEHDEHLPPLVDDSRKQSNASDAVTSCSSLLPQYLSCEDAKIGAETDEISPVETTTMSLPQYRSSETIKAMADSDNDSLATLVPQDASEEEEPLAAEQETEEELQSLDGLKKKARKEIRLKETMILSLELMKEEPVTSANVWEYVDVTKDAQNDVAYVKTKRMGDSDKKNVEIKMYNMKVMKSIYQASESDTADHVYDDLIKSLKKGPLKRTGAGKSGSKMYWSADKQVIVKSLSPIEVSKGKYFMKDYCEYMRSVDSSFLVKYYCLVRVRRGTSLDYYIVMRNTFPPGFIPKTVYDLKGSLHGRRGEKDDLMKDLDFVEQSPQFQFSDGPQKAQFLAQLIDDLAFLKNNKIIDYSALIGNDGEVWHMGIIDIMTPYTQKKKGEYKVFGFLHGKEKISCNPPDNYAYRFFNFLVKGLLKD